MFYSDEVKLPEEVIEMLSVYSRYLIIGAANTGKTLLAETFADHIASSQSNSDSYIRIVRNNTYGIPLPNKPKTQYILLLDDVNNMGHLADNIMDIISDNMMRAILTISSPLKFSNDDFLVVKILERTPDTIKISMENKEYDLPTTRVSRNLGLLNE